MVGKGGLSDPRPPQMNFSEAQWMRPYLVAFQVQANGVHCVSPTQGPALALGKGGHFHTARAQRQLLRCLSREHP